MVCILTGGQIVSGGCQQMPSEPEPRMLGDPEIGASTGATRRIDPPKKCRDPETGSVCYPTGMLHRGAADILEPMAQGECPQGCPLRFIRDHAVYKTGSRLHPFRIGTSIRKT